MGKLCQLSLELWPLIDVILFSYIELIFRGGVSCLPAALLFLFEAVLTSTHNLCFRAKKKKKMMCTTVNPSFAI